MTDKMIKKSNTVKIRRVLISVSEKEGIEDFAKKLFDFGVEILSTGGTASLLKKTGLDVTDVSNVTGFPEIMDGRIKTLHPKIHGGLLARRDSKDHLQAMSEHDIDPIDMVVINLYPFNKTVRQNSDFQTCIENIDIGGPAMIRAAAKNHDFLSVVTTPQDYETVLRDMRTYEGCVSYNIRKILAANAFALCAAYDSAIANWFSKQTENDSAPRHISFTGRLKQELRYGENPHQKAALYTMPDSERPGACTANQVQGKELSYNNLNDTNAAFELVSEFDEPAVAIIKHANPCGVSVSKSPLDAYKNALICDPVSAYGGIIALNRTLDKELAETIIKRFVEVIIAPDIEQSALEVLNKKSKIRVLTTGSMPPLDNPRKIATCIAGGLLIQDADTRRISKNDLKVVTDREPTDQEMRDMLFAFRVAKHVKSNAIVYAKNTATVGIGAGQMSRVDSARIAAWKAQEAAKEVNQSESLAKNSVVASDAFFPFADGLISAAEAGVTAVIQPGGSIRDEEVIEAANERGLAMVLTGTRHFKH